MSEAYGNRLGTMPAKDKKEEYDKGLGSMSAEAKSEAYTKELGSMSAEANSEAYDKGFGSMSAASSDKWEECAEFEAHDGMHVLGTKLHNWQKNQLSNRPTSLDARIEKEIATNEWGTVWSDRKGRLESSIAQKYRAMRSDKWEEQYAVFQAHMGMPARGTKLYNWQKNQLSNIPTGLNARIKKEIAANEGVAVQSSRKARLC